MQINKLDIQTYFYDLMISIGLEDNLKQLSITDLDDIIESVNLQRLSNNPKALDRKHLIEILRQF